MEERPERSDFPHCSVRGNGKRTYPTVQYGRTCPYCKSGETWLLKGNECIIKEIEVED